MVLRQNLDNQGRVLTGGSHSLHCQDWKAFWRSTSTAEALCQDAHQHGWSSVADALPLQQAIIPGRRDLHLQCQCWNRRPQCVESHIPAKNRLAFARSPLGWSKIEEQRKRLTAPLGKQSSDAACHVGGQLPCLLTWLWDSADKSSWRHGGPVDDDVIVYLQARQSRRPKVCPHPSFTHCDLPYPFTAMLLLALRWCFPHAHTYATHQ